MDYRTLVNSIDDLDPEYRRLAATIGLDKYLDLCDEYGGQSVYFPQIYKVSNIARAKAMKADYDNGVAVCDIARKYKIALGTAYVIIKKFRDGTI